MRDFHLPGRSPVLTANGMCATSHPLAAKVAVQILEDGGNAVDAAIAGAVLLGLCEPQMTGLGGDLFALIAPSQDAEVIALNGSGRAPAALSGDGLRARGMASVPLHTADSVTLPGAVDAFCTLSETFGRLGLDHVLAPAIHYAEAGIPIAPRVAFDWAEAEATLARAPTAKSQEFYLSAGKAPRAGSLFRAPGQAEVLRKVVQQGRRGFYEGEVAEDMVDTLRALGGTHTLEDFASVACTQTSAVTGAYKGLNIHEHPPNGQGATALLMLNMLKHFDVAAMDPWGATRVHIEAEIAKLAYDARNRMIADADYMTRLDHFLAPETAAQLAALIDPKRAMASPAALSESVHKDTVYITVVDKDRMSVSLIYSIFHSFGSGLATDKFGLLLQNRGAGFTLEPGHPNEAQGGKRPMHTIIPGMLERDGKITMPFGVMGGAYQPNGHARFVTSMVDHHMDAQTAIDGPRAFSDSGVLKVEKGYGDDVRAALSAMGHTVEIPHGPIGGAQAIEITEDGMLIGASDPRKDGCALGY